MKKPAIAILPLLCALSLMSCMNIKLISDYDPIIDRGITEFAEQFNTHVKNMGDLAGTPDGTFNANVKTYNALESKLDVMISRASIDAAGSNCKLEQQTYERIQSVLKDNIPAALQSSNTASSGNASGCNTQLLQLVKEQLSFIKQIHRETDKCGEKQLSCLRPATAKTALDIANQSINAAAMIEAAKKP